MIRILPFALVGALVVPWGPVLADDALGPEPRSSDEPSTTEGRGHGRWGLLLGTAGGIAAAFAVAAMTGTSLDEVGSFVVIPLGGGLGAFVGQKIGSSAGKPWEDPGKLQVSLRHAWTMSAASKDIQAAFDESAFAATNEHHSIAPSVAVTYRLGRRFNTGLELSRLSAHFRYSDSAAHLIEWVSGSSFGLVFNYAPMPSERRRLTGSLGAGVDYYPVNIEEYFDEGFEARFPEGQLSRFSRSADSAYGLQLRGSLDCYIVHDVSIQLSVSGRWVSPIDVEGISLTHPSPALSRSLVPHTVNLSSVHLSIGVGMGF